MCESQAVSFISKEGWILLRFRLFLETGVCMNTVMCGNLNRVSPWNVKMAVMQYS